MGLDLDIHKSNLERLYAGSPDPPPPPAPPCVWTVASRPPYPALCVNNTLL